MEQVQGRIELSYSDAPLNGILRRAGGGGVNYTRHFSQSEEFFLRLTEPFAVPRFPIHHDVRRREPKKSYLETLRAFMDKIQRLLPDVFTGLTYMFDPAETLRPCFFQLYRIGQQTYLYLLRIDLVFRPHVHEVEEKGSNDETPVYTTSDLIVEADFVPLQAVGTVGDRIAGFEVLQMISDTWIGETGRGYFVQGIWLDNDLTKFFSKLVIPENKRIYPYYPFTSKFRTLTHSIVGLQPEQRRQALPYFHRVQQFLRPHLEQIQETLRETEFSQDLPLFAKLRETVPSEWTNRWKDFALKVYLNNHDMKEFQIVENS